LEPAISQYSNCENEFISNKKNKKWLKTRLKKIVFLMLLPEVIA